MCCEFSGEQRTRGRRETSEKKKKVRKHVISVRRCGVAVVRAGEGLWSSSLDASRAKHTNCGADFARTIYTFRSDMTFVSKFVIYATTKSVRGSGHVPTGFPA